MRRRIALLLAAALLASTGCDRIRAALEERQELTDQQRAIQAYSDATPKVNLAQQRFVQAWELAVKNEQVAPLEEAIEKQVVPALDAYVKALREMPAGTPDLKRIHGLLLSAYETLQTDVAAFIEALSEENRKEPVDALVERLEALTRAEDAYRKELKAYYESHNITLISEKTDEPDDPDDDRPAAAPSGGSEGQLPPPAAPTPDAAAPPEPAAPAGGADATGASASADAAAPPADPAVPSADPAAPAAPPTDPAAPPAVPSESAAPAPPASEAPPAPEAAP